MNNKGVTLVELLVSITILSIVVGAFYSCFVLAAKTNAKAKMAHKATTLAQNLMENIKSEDMDNLMGQIVWPTYTVAQEDGSVRTVQNFRLVSQSGYDVGNVISFAEADKPYATSNDGGITTVYNPEVDSYSFSLRNVKMENTSFDALVTVKASEAVDGAGESIGTKDMVHIPSMDSNYDAVVSNAAVYDVEALSYFESKGVYDVLSHGNITRTITVDVDKDPKLSGQIGYEVKATYRYECEDELYEVTDLAFSNEGDMSKALRNVFIFYKPHFSWVDTDDWTEKIVANNPDDYPLDLYLIKQQPTDDEGELGQEETTEYCVAIDINEPYSSTDEHSSIRIKTNLGYAFKNPTIPMTLYKQGVYTVNGASVSNYEDFFRMAALTNKSETELLFDVNIRIYAGDATRTVSGASSYDGETVLAELNGTLRN
ncbi:MAG: prepilin-type N-terminal cleavage/methylation domain-containing protein [Lachnospiraceae bacterium]|nr:prepilin-type N-terminal cleavage/methylation domain-containing protein [Lachnospiraceae bacterium]